MMNLFDKLCAIPAIIVGALFMVLGAIGLFLGCSANFTLPPVLGALPFFVGWAMCVVVIKYWILSNKLKNASRPPLDPPHGQDFAPPPYAPLASPVPPAGQGADQPGLS